MKILLYLATVIMVSTTLGMEKNILLSTDFVPSPCGEFGYWTIGQADVEARLLPGAGPEGQNGLNLQFRNTEFFSHLNIQCVPSGKYLIGGYVRTNDFSCPKGAGFMVTDGSAAYWRIKTKAFPANTDGQWVKVEKTITLPKDRAKLCHFRVFAPKATGQLDIAAPFMVPLGEAEENGTSVQPPVLYTYKRIFLVSPVLDRIASAKPEMLFTVYYPIDGKHLDYELQVTIDKTTGRFPLDFQHNVRVELPPIAPGSYRLELKLLHKTDGAVVLENSYPCVVRAQMTMPPQEKWLNNLVSELAVLDIDGDLEYDLTAPRDGWIFLGFEKAEETVKVFLDGGDKPVVVYRPDERLETMRYLAEGPHHLRITGVQGKNRLSIRTIKQLQLFPLNAFNDDNRPANFPARYFRYDLPFYRKYLWPAVNTQLLQYEFAPLLPEQREECLERGIRLITSGNAKWEDPAAIEKSVREERFIEQYDGRALDEAGYWWGFDRQLSVAEALFNLADFDKSVYLWMAKTRGHLYYPMVHRPLLAAASNAGCGRGKMMMETYISNSRDEKATEEYMMLLNDHVRFAEKCVPDAKSRMCFMLSGYITLGGWDINIYPESDMKYAMDYFFWKFATDPELKGIYGLGCYDINGCDEERLRWVGALMRHYCVEGRTDRLADKYGFKCNPGHLKNCDFEQKLDDWDAAPAEPDSIAPWHKPNYGILVQMRQIEEGSVGDHAALLVKSAKAPNKLSQTATGLIPGKKYSLFFVSADADDIDKPKEKKAPFVFQANISDATIVPELGYILKKPGDTKSRAQMRNHKIVFIPEKPEVTITFTDWEDDQTPGQPAAQKCVLNFVSLTPYFD
jgi:hypothetical protein